MMENFAKIGFLFTYDKVLNMPLISFSKHEQIFRENLTHFILVFP